MQDIVLRNKSYVTTARQKKNAIGLFKIGAGFLMCAGGVLGAPEGFGFPMIYFGSGFMREGITDWRDVIYS